MVISLLFLSFAPHFALASLVFVLPLALSLVFQVGLYKPRLFWKTSTDPWLRGEHSLAIQPTGMFYRSGQGEQAIPWQQVKAIEQDAYNLYFLLTINGPLARSFTRSYRNMKGVRLFLNRVCLVPKQAFVAPLQANTFYDLATAF